ncbi:hypothetical protein MFRU_010g02510 [Monilinia fructicola]|uniref:DUF4604 domain-containing protein n=1 Tax=Monilinia fructicola TaxID=38448 RepID=A0A5M9JH06_MONFR|nr:hypothetical protein EYC84_008088 [Monilinia fructicola]KAG4031126.1 hypothetical protein MFRU_010g02510 [Monilinia fructicola]
MSHPKITPKNLTYNGALPPFLQRLQSNASGSARHDPRAARPTKQKDEDEERESEPVVFDEGSGETLSREEWEQREKEREEKGKEGGEEDGGEGTREAKGEVAKSKTTVTETAVIGASKKRKVGRIIGALGDEEEKLVQADDESYEGKDNGEAKSEGRSKAGTEEKKKARVAAKKGKKIKLSFGDDE